MWMVTISVNGIILLIWYILNKKVNKSVCVCTLAFRNICENKLSTSLCNCVWKMNDEVMSMACIFFKGRNNKNKKNTQCSWTPYCCPFPISLWDRYMTSVSFKCQLVNTGVCCNFPGLYFLQALKTFPVT